MTMISGVAYGAPFPEVDMSTPEKELENFKRWFSTDRNTLIGETFSQYIICESMINHRYSDAFIIKYFDSLDKKLFLTDLFENGRLTKELLEKLKPIQKSDFDLMLSGKDRIKIPIYIRLFINKLK